MNKLARPRLQTADGHILTDFPSVSAAVAYAASFAYVIDHDESCSHMLVMRSTQADDHEKTLFVIESEHGRCDD